MAWGRMKCVACGHVFDAYVAELQAQRKLLGPVGEPIRHFDYFAMMSGSGASIRCPKCQQRQRMAFWPFIPLVCSMVVLWTVGITMMMALISEIIPTDVVAPLPWIVGACFAISLVYAIIAHSIAKPIRC